MYHFCLAAFKIFLFIFGFQHVDSDVPGCGCLCVYPVYGSLSFLLDSHVYIFHQNEKKIHRTYSRLYHLLLKRDDFYSTTQLIWQDSKSKLSHCKQQLNPLSSFSFPVVGFSRESPSLTHKGMVHTIWMELICRFQVLPPFHGSLLKDKPPHSL